VTDILKDLDKRLDGLEKCLEANLAKRQDAATQELRGELEAKIKAQQDLITKLEATKQEAARAALPGIEYAKNGEDGKFSLWRAIQLGIAEQAPNALSFNPWKAKSHGLEAEVIRQLRDQIGSDQITKAAMNIGTDAAGGALVPSTVMFDSIVPELEANAVAYQAGVRRMDGLRGNFSWIVDEGGTIAYYIDTEAEQAMTSSENTYSVINARAHTMGAETNLTRGMRMQSAIAMEARVRQVIGRKLALREDRTIFFGSGSASEPRGITNVPTLTTAVNFSGITYTGATQTLTDKLREMVYAPAINLYDNPAGRWAWVSRAEVGRKIANCKDADGRQLVPTNDRGRLTSLFGLPFLEYNQTTPAKASNDEFLLYGDFSAAIALHWGGLDFKVGYVGTNQSKDVLTVTAFMDHDVIVEQGKGFVPADNFATT
jgi:HK97 family phage major capsid protein